jgi:pimeloyl-ACP methyl ester carboxylesterase
VLTGHSTGGLISRLYVSYPKEVVGLVLLDGIPEGMQAAMTPEQWTVYDRLLLTDPPKELAGYKDLETIDFDVSSDQMRAGSKATPLAPIPFIVISKGKPFALPPGLPRLAACDAGAGLDQGPGRACSASPQHAAPDCHQEQPLR